MQSGRWSSRRGAPQDLLLELLHAGLVRVQDVKLVLELGTLAAHLLVE